MRGLCLRTFAAACCIGLAAGTAAGPVLADADRRVQIGDPVEDVELKTIEGKKDHLLQKGIVANIFVFFRLEHERSLDTLKDMAACEKEFASRPVRWVGVVSDSWDVEQVKAFVKEAGVRMPVLVDAGDALYGKLGIRLHPVIGIVDRKGKLAAFEPFRQINYCERIRVRIKFLLGEVSEAEVAKVDNPESSPLPHSDQGVARRHMNFARTLHMIKQDEKALEELKKSLAIVPTAAAYALQGQILAGQGKCPDAVRAFDAALKMEPSNTVATDGRKSCAR